MHPMKPPSILLVSAPRGDSRVVRVGWIVSVPLFLPQTLSLYLVVISGTSSPTCLTTTFSDECLGLNTDEGRSEV